MSPLQRCYKKFAHAIRGLIIGVHGQSSFIVHLLAASAAIAAGWYLSLTAVEWALLAITIGLVLAIELVNSGLESLARAVSDQEHPWIGDALDIAAGAVLLASLVAVIVGSCLFLPKLW